MHANSIHVPRNFNLVTAIYALSLLSWSRENKEQYSVSIYIHNTQYTSTC